jgi:hypothetical protein
LANTLDRLGAETVDAIAMSAPAETTTHSVHPARGPEPRRGPIGPMRAPHQIRVEIPDPMSSRSLDRDDDRFDD